MNLLFWVLLGIVQGLLEWIPVSSEAFLVIISMLYDVDPSTALIIAILMHFSTSLAAIVYYRREYINVIKYVMGIRRDDQSSKLLSYFIIAGSTTLLIGLVIYYSLMRILALVESMIRIGSVILMIIIGSLLISIGLLMKKARTTEQFKTIIDLNPSDSFALGITQALSILPGVSRSGITISTLLLRNYNQDSSVKLSFLIAPVVIIPASIFEALSNYSTLSRIGLIELILAETISFIVSLIAIKFMTKLARTLNIHRFMILIGSIIILLNLPYLVRMLAY